MQNIKSGLQDKFFQKDNAKGIGRNIAVYFAR